MSANLRRQFQRVQQKLDQTIGRAEKSKVLNEDQQVLEKRVELIRVVCHNVSKRLKSCSVNQEKADADSLLKKIPRYGLSQGLLESAEQLGLQTHIGQIFKQCGEAEGNVAKANLDMDLKVDEEVLKPVNDILKNDVPLIQKLRKQLSDQTLDMDAAKARYAAALKQQGNPNMPQSRIDAARDEASDLSVKVEQTRDQLATEMYTFIAKESDLGRYMLELVKAEVDYHRHSLQLLECLIPQIEEAIEFSIAKPVFGQSLEAHLESSKTGIAGVLMSCITTLEEYGLEEEGLFRLAGSAQKVKKLKAVLNYGTDVVIDCQDDYDPHVVATVMKQYLRELPEPLMTFDLYNEWMQACSTPLDQRIAAVQVVLSKMPRKQKDNLRYLIKFLAKLAEFSDVNKMTPSNIALVIAPNLLWPSGGDSGLNMLAIQSNLVELLISNADFYFPDGDHPDSAGVHGVTTPKLCSAGSSGKSPRLDATSDRRPSDPFNARGSPNTTVTTEEFRTPGLTHSPSAVRRPSKKAPAPKPPSADTAVASTAKELTQMQISVDGTDTEPVIPPSPSPRPSKPKDRPSERPPDRPTERPPERPPTSPPTKPQQSLPQASQASIIFPFSSSGFLEKSDGNGGTLQSPSSGGGGNDVTNARLYPMLPPAEAPPQSGPDFRQHIRRPSDQAIQQHARKLSDQGVQRSSRPMPPPPPVPRTHE